MKAFLGNPDVLGNLGFPRESGFLGKTGVSSGIRISLEIQGFLGNPDFQENTPSPPTHPQGMVEVLAHERP